MRKLFVLAVLAIPALVSGCGLVSLSTNIPFFSGSGTLVEVINRSDYEVSLTVNGHPQTFEFEGGRTSNRLPTGGSTSFRVFNWSDYSGQLTISAKAWNGKEFVGSDAIQVSVDNYQQQASTLMVDNDDRSGVRFGYPGGLFRW